jgi:hypothetical protein
MSDPVDAGAFAVKYGQMDRAPSDKDRDTLLRNFLNNFTVSATQAVDIILLFRSAETMCVAARMLAPRVNDTDNFGPELMKRLPYDDDRVALGEALGLEVTGLAPAPEPKAEEGDAKFSGHAWIS